MQSHYEINVSKDGKHYFATAPRSLPVYPRDKAKHMLEHFRILFPEADGFNVTLTRYEVAGYVEKA